MKTAAFQKLSEPLDKKKLSQKGKIVADFAIKALKEFCDQNGEFAQAVVQGKTAAECIEAAVKGSGNHLSDLELCRKAAQFYFPGADVEFIMKINLGDGGFSNSAEIPAKKGLSLSLDELLK